MRKLVLLGTTLALALVTTLASANGTATRNGADYSGSRGTCEFRTEGTELHVKCTHGVDATGPAYVRYRFLSDVGGERQPATISADIVTWIGEPCTAKWMIAAPFNPARTLRVRVPAGSYCHIRSVSWSQP